MSTASTPSRGREAATGDAPILEVRGLTVGLPGGADRKTAVRSVSFTVDTSGALNDVTATIPVGDAASGKLFGRLAAVQQP